MGTYNSDGSMSSGGKGGVGQAGQPNYVPTQGTQGNPSVSIGFGMPPPVQADGAPTDAYSPGVTSDSATPQGLYNQYANTIFGSPTAGYGGEQAGPYSINGPAPMPTGPAFNGAGATSVPVQGMPTAGGTGGKGGLAGSNLGSTLGNVVGQFGNLAGQGLTQAGLGPLGNVVGQVSNLGGQMLNTGLNAAQQPRVSNANLQNPRAVNRFAPPNAPGVRPKQVAGAIPALANKLTVTRRK